MMLELDENKDIVWNYTWALDLSGTFQVAGGTLDPIASRQGQVGGLLATRDVSDPNLPESYVFFYDANGNVGQLIDLSDGSIDAKYEYDPYGGNLLDPTDPQESGPYAAENSIRFSTKYFDTETALGYWGYRYYSPQLGRWLSRDPIGELGGLNVYAAFDNDGVNTADKLGLERCSNSDMTEKGLPELSPYVLSGKIDVASWTFPPIALWIYLGHYTDTVSPRWVKVGDDSMDNCGGTTPMTDVFEFEVISGVEILQNLTASVSVGSESIGAELEAAIGVSLKKSTMTRTKRQTTIITPPCTYKRVQKFQVIERHNVRGGGSVFRASTRFTGVQKVGTFSVSASWDQAVSRTHTRVCEETCCP